ncbi:fumarylacetoacetase [Variovorax sp. PCZ-1]|uniref:fumarylacetoacetase n=1 Tax=Variovorax sp. PCZ-1 TaxID=2835533 RepID=UPI001BD12089|nr:fumarylacetoacetase [Variovorax sp. PCZ-1]MBS7807165.1 fumarylacetoacetase [Variovorax sp. PCZ-1]
MNTLNHTHEAAAKSWVASAQGHADFPIQNLPYAVFCRKSGHEAWRGGVAIGDEVLDLAALQAKGLLSGLAAQALHEASQSTLNAFMAMGHEAWHALRIALFDLLSSSASEATQNAVRNCLVPQTEVRYNLPTQIGNYTDFYTSIYHAENVGRIIRPDDPLTPNFQWLPIAYHGRASSVVISGTPFRRPMGQAMPPGTKAPVYGACARLDFELEMGFFVGPSNALGEPVALKDAPSHIFGMCLLNDWSARDHQFWEMNPLGPFLGKNFCTSISPWIVTMEALAPFRQPFERPADHPQPLAYLDEASNRAAGSLDIQLSVAIESVAHRTASKPASRISATSFKHQYWTTAQMLTQHTVGGCNLQSGDLIGTGTISGPTASEAGAIVELSQGGRVQVPLHETGEQRTFLLDGDAVIFQGWCEKTGFARIGFGSCSGTVLPAIS